jgi:glycosyltransferase involved in cell wall biosynthesis
LAAFIPFFVLSPNTIMSIIGYIHGPDKTIPTPKEDWRKAKVDVVIPAFNEEHTIPFCLASLARQTLKPQRVILVDDGSHDKTLQCAESFCKANKIELISIRRKASIGKTPTIKRQSREFDSDVEFILDADTILESENYIERTVQELYQAVGIASACGTILPLREKDRRSILSYSSMQSFISKVPKYSINSSKNWLEKLNYSITNLYRDVLYLFLQKFIYRGQIVFFGSMINPVGCAVAYRRKYIKDLFDHYEPIMGDDLTTSEDIFIGFSNLNEGYRNIQLTDVVARSMEPKSTYLPHQVFLWSSSFIQSCYYFNDLLMSPFKFIKRYLYQRRQDKKIGKIIMEMRKVREPYRQAFGSKYTKKFGRPVGWCVLTSSIEKISFPTIIVIMVILGWWKGLGITITIEAFLALLFLTVIAKGHRLEYFFKGILITPIRYSLLLFDLVVFGKFVTDIWISKNRNWRK